MRSLPHSADLDIYLMVDCQRMEVESCFGNKCRLRSPVNIPPSHAELVIVIDGEERRRQVFLKDGISKNFPEVELSSALPVGAHT